MTKKEFADLFFSLEEHLMESALPVMNVGRCGGACKGIEEEDCKNLCPKCLTEFHRATEELKTLNQKVGAVTEKLLEALKNDKEGELSEAITMMEKTSKATN